MSPNIELTTVEYVGFPRVSGDEPIAEDAVHRDAKFSPRERG